MNILRSAASSCAFVVKKKKKRELMSKKQPGASVLKVSQRFFSPHVIIFKKKITIKCYVRSSEMELLEDII